MLYWAIHLSFKQDEIDLIINTQAGLLGCYENISWVNITPAYYGIRSVHHQLSIKLLIIKILQFINLLFVRYLFGFI